MIRENAMKLMSALNIGALELAHRVIITFSGYQRSPTRAISRLTTRGGLITLALGKQPTLRTCAVTARASGGLPLARLLLPRIAKHLDQSEIDDALEAYRRAARIAKAAGCVGVELDASASSLPGQFLYPMEIRRTDRYGGDAGNRVTFLEEAVYALVDVWGTDRVGVCISPPGEVWQPDPPQLEQILVALAMMRDVDLAFAHLKGTFSNGSMGGAAALSLRRAFPGMLIVGGDGTLAHAVAAVESGWADGVSVEASRLEPTLLEMIRKVG
jgi:2,4-dienoyl-CoA reductase-like NADH-dependent reductase (Old Yellow Enzyme family)